MCWPSDEPASHLETTLPIAKLAAEVGSSTHSEKNRGKQAPFYDRWVELIRSFFPCLSKLITSFDRSKV